MPVRTMLPHRTETVIFARAKLLGLGNRPKFGVFVRQKYTPNYDPR